MRLVMLVPFEVEIDSYCQIEAKDEKIYQNGRRGGESTAL